MSGLHATVKKDSTERYGSPDAGAGMTFAPPGAGPSTMKQETPMDRRTFFKKAGVASAGSGGLRRL